MRITDILPTGAFSANRKARAAASRFPTRQLLIRAGFSGLATLLFLWLLADRLAQIDGAALLMALGRLEWRQWALALGLTAVSFWAVGHYDAVVHRHLATGTPGRIARRAGVCAIAVSQSLGLGLISGAILRWRMLPGISLWQATRITAAVALSFLAGWAVVTSATLMLLPSAPFRDAAALVLALTLGLALLSIAGPRLRPLPWRWPNAFTLSRLVGLCAVDTLAAALALQVLLPADSGVAFATLLPAFLLALGAGLVLGTPGGVGAFEVTFLALLPPSAEPALLPAILAWRLAYYALPACIGAGLAILGPVAHVTPPRQRPALPAETRAETGLIGQSGLGLVGTDGAIWMAARSGHSLLALLDPITTGRAPALDHALRGFCRLSRDESRQAVIYKASARLAARGRRRGMAVRRIGWEGWLCPAGFDADQPSCAGLRRKLRRAEAEGVRVLAFSGGDAHGPHGGAAQGLRWSDLDRIDTEWRRGHGRERGFSMGRHHADHLARQRLYVAFKGEHPIAYVSFHTATREWTLDLMRHVAALPDGTMHRLVTAAILDAAAKGIPRLSLAAVPDGAVPFANRLRDGPARVIAAMAPATTQPGLYRFKAAFAPDWSPLYLVAPSRPGLALAGLSLWRAIARPGPLMPEIERDHADYGFASGPHPWHIPERPD